MVEEWMRGGGGGIAQDMRLLSACISGACQVDELETMLAEAGFTRIDINPKDESREFIREWEPGSRLEGTTSSLLPSKRSNHRSRLRGWVGLRSETHGGGWLSPTVMVCDDFQTAG